MLTTCPHCSLNLAVTAADLRLGQGYVRCGRCVSVFNALISLSDDIEAADRDAERLSAKGTTTMPALPEPRLAEDDADDVEEPAEPLEEEAAAGEPRDEPRDEHDERDYERMQGTGTFETIVLEGDAISQTEETVTESEVDAQLQALVQRFDAVRERDVAQSDEEWIESAVGDGEQGVLLEFSDSGEFIRPAGLQDAVATEDPLASEYLEEDGGFAAQDELPTEDEVRRKRLLLGGCIALGFLLLLQILNHYRQALADTRLMGSATTGLYNLFGVQLEPSWDLAKYEVHQLGASALAGEVAQIAVRASIRNAANRAQPPPLLRIVLQDRFGNRLATREVTPAEYLRGTPPRLLAADQRVDTQLLLADPGQNAVGFEIDACLKAADGALRCASDPASP
ncbi:MAG: zinc-ribbon and DUF3426 domain-containing protein [Pseudomonadota bacterium]